jgi:hypothetical protein
VCAKKLSRKTKAELFGVLRITSAKGSEHALGCLDERVERYSQPRTDAQRRSEAVSYIQYLIGEIVGQLRG